MKFLCLHGNGTNSNVSPHVMDNVLSLRSSSISPELNVNFGSRTAPEASLRHELSEDNYQFEFVEAAIECSMSRGIERLVSPGDKFYAYYDPEDLPNTLMLCIDQLNDYISTEGPFDGVIGFSAGAVLAAMYIVESQRRDGKAPFRCAIFLSSASSIAELQFLGFDPQHDQIQIPTLHIWGLDDHIAPTGGEDICQILNDSTSPTNNQRPTDLNGIPPNTSTPYSKESELDGNEDDPIVVCGFSLKFPQEATSPDAFWDMMMKRRCAMTDFPPNRINHNGFYQKQKTLQTLPLRGAHFIKDDPSVFDAEFFSISPNEATAMDPMQRWLLEAAYRAFENAGMPMESLAGSSTAVYTGSFSLDYMLQLSRDPEYTPTYAAVGFGLSLLANRLSWFFDLKGPSVGLDSACSSTAMALDVACNALRAGSCKMAIVAGCNLATSPEPYIWMSNISFLSPDSRCHAFDHRANGYARGEGIAVVVLKRLSDALRDGNTIRAVIRSTGSNEDGRTPGITQPSRIAQEQLILDTYQRAGLSMKHTRFFEAHGTGTQAGDPREAQAIGSSFQKYRSRDDPLYVGAVKSNIGHLEGASGLAALIKTVLVLERGIIPPNTNFEKVNPKIDQHFLNIKFPTEPKVWPSDGLRRASINSFGYGGANSHVVLDDAFNYLRLRSLKGNHNTRPSILPANGLNGPEYPEIKERVPRLMVWSAADKDGLNRMAKDLEDYYHIKETEALPNDSFLDSLAKTLSYHRSRLPWRSFALLETVAELGELESRLSVPIKASPKAPRIGFVFTGQGAQWFAMGRELFSYPSFDEEIQRATMYLQSLGCRWDVKDELFKTESLSRVDQPEFSQTLCTVLQVAIVNLLREFDVRPSAVVGHSSGEIAAAYAGGYIDQESAWKLAYFRGRCSAELYDISDSQQQGAMMSVGLSESEAQHLLKTNIDGVYPALGVSIGCVNSPKSVTLTGDNDMIDLLKVRLDDMMVPATKLRVKVAYHSQHMQPIAAKYELSIGKLSCADKAGETVPMISTVTETQLSQAQLLEPSYWAQNMVLPVKFLQAISTMCARTSTQLTKKIDKSHLRACVVDHLLEIGPHAGLQGPIRDIIRASSRQEPISYASVLKRHQSSTETMLRAMGELFCKGSILCFEAINQRSNGQHASPSMIVDLPEYPFDHTQSYWHESRLSRNYRLRNYPPSDILGVRSRDWNPSDARWRHIIRVAEMAWTEHHVVNGATLYPGPGMFAMAIESAKQLVLDKGHDDISGFVLRDVHLERPMNLSANGDVIETQICLKEMKSTNEGWSVFEFTIRTYVNDEWWTNCYGTVTVELSQSLDVWNQDQAKIQQANVSGEIARIFEDCKTRVDEKYMYTFLQQSGLEYGPMFQAVRHQYCNGQTKQAVAEVNLFDKSDETCVVHPASLDPIIHLCFTAFSRGGTQPMATHVPSFLSCLWVSNTGLNRKSESSVRAYTSIDSTSSRGFTCSGGALDSHDIGKARVWYDGLELTSVTSAQPSSHLPTPTQYCMNVDYQVALNKMTNDEIFVLLANLYGEGEDLVEFYEQVERLVLVSLERLVKSIDPASFEENDLWRTQYWKWAQHHLGNAHAGEHGVDMQLEVANANDYDQERTAAIESRNQVGRLYVAVAKHLENFFAGDLTFAELLMETDLLKNYYEEFTSSRCALQAAAYLDLLSHQKPGLKILELGGGTASATRKFVETLSHGPGGHTMASLRCERYDFTDVSSTFLKDAKEFFADFHAQMTFRTLDIERDFDEQGFENGTYDVIIAYGVLHLTADLANTLRNARKALRPGGKLIMHELLRADGWTAGFIFGLSPTWWIGAQDNRQLSPSLSSDGWDAILKENGFSGADLTLKDYDNNVAHNLGCIIATAIVQPEQIPPEPQVKGLPITVIADRNSPVQVSLAETLVPFLQDHTGSESKMEVVDFTDATIDDRTREDSLVVFLAEYGAPFLTEMDETSWAHLKDLIRTSRHLLWVSGTPGGVLKAHPSYGVIDGLARTLRTEYYDLHLVTVVLDTSEPPTKQVSHLSQIVREMLAKPPHDNYEQEYFEIDGYLHIRRLVEAEYLKTDMNAKLLPYHEVKTTVGQAQFEASKDASTGHGDVPHYVATPSVPDELDGDSVIVQVESVSLQGNDKSLPLQGELEPVFGDYCAGIVVSSSPEASFRRGDRVLVAQAGCLRSHVRVSSQNLVELPTDVSCSRACSVAPSAVAAYHALVDIAHARPGDKVLVHQGASNIGQAAIETLLRLSGIETWTTASDEDEANWITEHLSLPSDRILPTTWFERNPIMASKWKRAFDVVLSSSVASTPLLTNCVRHNGQYVFLSALPSSSSARDRQRLPPGIQYSTVHIGPQNATREALRHAVQISSNFKADNTKYLPQEFSASQLDDAFATLRAAQDQKRVVINFGGTDTIQVRVDNKPSIKLNPKATYLIAGGFGGAGRVMARWLIDRGARYLLLISRSGPCTAEAQELLAECEAKGVQVDAPLCDVSDLAALKKVLASCAEKMPPIKGCFQSVMVVTERIFERMEFQDWKVTTDPKVKGSWNLHSELPRDLDFFILLSSMMGIIGRGSLSAYAAATHTKTP
ncbi:hypothetical protein NUW58_g1566 [Xylaria curta]|uniref:Uncharacterized protein n=1 Tax=Xylaria curta TaxID=42375 RepID=A0ACC1PM64_9PEZI|nr:hypothetical protein NUW58_g1566 [Xylaria curta]